MGRAPTRTTAPTQTGEQYWTLVGARRGRVWYARRVGYCLGAATSVRFDGAGVLRREEMRGDVLGFFHTHPAGPLSPSARDVRTMRAWCSSFGKPLLCVIASLDGLAGYRFEDDGSEGVALDAVEVFPRGVVIGVDTDGGQVPP